MFGVVALNLCESWFPSRVLDDLSYKYDKTEYTITAGPLHSKTKIWYHVRR